MCQTNQSAQTRQTSKQTSRDKQEDKQARSKAGKQTSKKICVDDQTHKTNTSRHTQRQPIIERRRLIWTDEHRLRTTMADTNRQKQMKQSKRITSRESDIFAQTDTIRHRQTGIETNRHQQTRHEKHKRDRNA